MKSSNQYEIKSDMGQRGCIIDIICGTGGLTHDFRFEGYRDAKGIEIDVAFRYLFTNYNNAPIDQMCVSSIDADEIKECFIDSDRKNFSWSCALPAFFEVFAKQ